MEFSEFEPSDRDAYRSLVMSNRSSLLYHSSEWLEFTSRYLHAEKVILLARAAGRVVGALPVLCKQGVLGTVANSLPFYGSNGAIVVDEAFDDPVAVKVGLLQAFKQTAEQRHWVLSTIISGPLESHIEIYRASEARYVDQRIGQLKPLSEINSENADAALMDSYHQKTRNMVRKANSSGFAIETSWSAENLRFLIETHNENMAAIGGLAKPTSFFESLESALPASMRRIYVARLGGQPIAAMLMLYFNETAEYYTPVIKEAFRSSQPLSALIHHALIDCVREGYRWWNWGGTWVSQEGVYRFKSRWGTNDYPYYYFTHIRGDMSALLDLGKAGLLREYPFFFTVPFSALDEARKAA